MCIQLSDKVYWFFLENNDLVFINSRTEALTILVIKTVPGIATIFTISCQPGEDSKISQVQLIFVNRVRDKKDEVFGRLIFPLFNWNHKRTKRWTNILNTRFREQKKTFNSI